MQDVLEQVWIVSTTHWFCSFDSGAFMIPYLVMLTLCGIPLVFMEFAIGQYTRLGTVHAFAKICPLFKGEWPKKILGSDEDEALIHVLSFSHNELGDD